MALLRFKVGFQSLKTMELHRSDNSVQGALQTFRSKTWQTWSVFRAANCDMGNLAMILSNQ